MNNDQPTQSVGQGESSGSIPARLNPSAANDLREQVRPACPECKVLGAPPPTPEGCTPPAGATAAPEREARSAYSSKGLLAALLKRDSEHERAIALLLELGDAMTRRVDGVLAFLGDRALRQGDAAPSLGALETAARRWRQQAQHERERVFPRAEHVIRGSAGEAQGVLQSATAAAPRDVVFAPNVSEPFVARGWGPESSRARLVVVPQRPGYGAARGVIETREENALGETAWFPVRFEGPETWVVTMLANDLAFEALRDRELGQRALKNATGGGA